MHPYNLVSFQISVYMPLNLSELAKELRTAAANGNITQARQCLTLDNVNIPGPHSGKTALHFAAQGGHGEIVTLLLQLGAQVNVQDKALETPLLLAVGNRHFTVAEQLLTAGCSVSIVSKAALNALQLALSQPAPAELIQQLRTKLISELTPSQHLKKNGSIQSLMPDHTQQIQASIKRHLDLAHLPLLPIIFSIYANHDYWFAFIDEQLPDLKRLGYQAIGSDENLALKQTNGFTCYQVGYNKQQKAASAYQKTLPSLLNKQLSEHASKHAGGIIYVLQIADSAFSPCLDKLSDVPLAVIRCHPTDDLSVAFDHLTLNAHHVITRLTPGTECEENFWQTMAKCVNQERIKMTYQDVNMPHLKARLQRLHEAFEVVSDNQVLYGITPVDRVTTYLKLAEKTERKLGITPLLQHTKRGLSLVIPQVTQLKVKPSTYLELPSTEKQKFKKILGQWLAYSAPSQLELPKNIGLRKTTLSLPPGQEIALESRLITKIAFLEFTQLKSNFFLNSHQLDIKSVLLELTFRNGKQLEYYMSNDLNAVPRYNKELAVATFNYLLAQGGLLDTMHAEREGSLKEDWRLMTHNLFYLQPVTNFYNKLHEFIAQRLVETSANIKSPIEIFSFGCGSGNELRVIKNQFVTKKIPFAGLYGFDINPNNFKLAKPDADIRLSEGDVTELAKLLNNMSLQENSHKIGLFLGVLVDGCLAGSYPALTAVQQARILDRIFISGITSLKLNKAMLKAAGFLVKTTLTNKYFELNWTSKKIISSTDPENQPGKIVFDLTPMSTQERKYYLTKRGQARSAKQIFDCLDLSLSANPLRDLQLFSVPALEKIKQVDVSWGYFQGSEVFSFLEKLSTLERPLHLLFSKHQVLANKIIEASRSYKNIMLVERLDEKLPQQCPMFSPADAKRYGIYEKLPNRAVERQKIRC